MTTAKLIDIARRHRADIAAVRSSPGYLFLPSRHRAERERAVLDASLARLRWDAACLDTERLSLAAEGLYLNALAACQDADGTPAHDHLGKASVDLENAAIQLEHAASAEHEEEARKEEAAGQPLLPFGVSYGREELPA